ncbi:MAG: AAA family ATPase [Planctomycetaceae bacterium]
MHNHDWNEYELGKDHSLDNRRPRKLADVVGLDRIKQRLSRSAMNGFQSRRLLFHGPTGSGKTTLAQIAGRMFFCTRSRSIGDACGECRTCRMNEVNFIDYQEWTGAELNDEWEWWRENGKVVLDRPNGFLFIDEAQDLSVAHQKELFRVSERANAMFVLATTHIHEIIDALVGRFGVNCFELTRPAINEAISLMESTARQIGIEADRQQLERAANHLNLNLRLCVDFIYTVKDQTPDGCLTEEFLTDLGVPEKSNDIGETLTML